MKPDTYKQLSSEERRILCTWLMSIIRRDTNEDQYQDHYYYPDMHPGLLVFVPEDTIKQLCVKIWDRGMMGATHTLLAESLCLRFHWSKKSTQLNAGIDWHKVRAGRALGE